MKILLLAGEESGVVYAERLKAEISKASSEPVEFKGYQDHFSTEDLGVFGIWEVVKRLSFFMKVKRTMLRVVDEWHPDAVVTIDYPGLNLRISQYAKSKGIPAIHIVCPQVWAWHRDRIPKIPSKMTRLLCFFPFEPGIFKDYESADFSARFIGHPMIDIFAEERGTSSSAGVVGGAKVAILPGSRAGEITRHMPRLIEAMHLVKGRVKDATFTIPAANARAGALIGKALASAGLEECVRVTDGGARDVLRKADAAVVASGTATLEAALAGVPTVLVYAVGPLLAAFLKRAITGVRHVGLANIIAEKAEVECPMPELLQENFTPKAVADIITGWLADAESRAAARKALSDVMARLHSDGAALALAAKEILSLAAGGKKAENA